MSEVISSFKNLRAGSQVFALRMLFLCVLLCLLRECDGPRLTAMLVWGMDEVW